MKSKIFISYARKDYDAVVRLRDEILRRTGIRPWMDLSGIETGTQFADVIAKAIDECELLVFVISRHSVKSEWTEREVLYAQDAGKKIYPVVIDDVELAGKLKFLLINVDRVDVRNNIEREKLFSDMVAFCAAHGPDDVAAGHGAATHGRGSARLSRPQGSHAFGKPLGILALLAALTGGAYYGWMRHDEGLKAKAAEIERIRQEEHKKLEDERKAIEERMAKLKAEADAVDAERRRGAAEKESVAPANGKLPLAKEKLDAAMGKLSESASSAKKFCIDTYTNTVKRWNTASKWRQCEEASNTVLNCEASNVEAKKLTVDVESHRVPTAVINVILDGKMLSGEEVKIDGQACKTPVKWCLFDGKTYEESEVAFERNGKRFFGSLEKFTVGWRGPREFMVVLKEYTAPKHGDIKKLILPGGVAMEMIYVGPGSFMMGSPSSEDGREDDEAQHRVALTKGFWLGRYEVTQAQWRSVMGTNPSNWKGDNLPVETVSWNDCMEFVRKVNAQLNCGARLPTEAEWEYACRAGTETAYSWSNALNGDKANCDGNYPYGLTEKGPYRRRPVPVGSYAANPWGFFDMCGNVYEWCNDRYGSYGGNETDPSGPASGGDHVLRGGCWRNSARYCRSASRGRFNADFRNYDCGFRLCCSAGHRE